jgi:hypothetical protein
MRALKLAGRVQADHTLRVRLPEDVEEGPAEVIVLLPERARHQPTLTALLDSLAQAPQVRRSKLAIDRQLEEERGTWDR